MQIYFIYIIYIYISDLYLKRKMYSNCNGYLSFDTSSSSIFSLSCASACDSFVNKLHSRWTCVSLWDSLLLCRASAHWKTGELANRWAGEPSAQAIQFSESRTSKRSRRRWFFEGGNNLDIDSVTVGDVFDSHVCQNSRWLFFVSRFNWNFRDRYSRAWCESLWSDVSPGIQKSAGMWLFIPRSADRTIPRKNSTHLTWPENCCELPGSADLIFHSFHFDVPRFKLLRLLISLMLIDLLSSLSKLATAIYTRVLKSPQSTDIKWLLARSLSFSGPSKCG